MQYFRFSRSGLISTMNVSLLRQSTLKIFVLVVEVAVAVLTTKDTFSSRDRNSPRLPYQCLNGVDVAPGKPLHHKNSYSEILR